MTTYDDEEDSYESPELDYPPFFFNQTSIEQRFTTKIGGKEKNAEKIFFLLEKIWFCFLFFSVFIQGETKKSKNKNRTEKDCNNYIDRIKLSSEIDVNSPRIHKFNNDELLYKYNNDNIQYRLCVFEFIDGNSFFDLNQIPTEVREEDYKNRI